MTLLHTRNYDVEVRHIGNNLQLTGSVRDVKPPGLYIADDPDPLTIHHMRVVLTARIEDLVIVDVDVVFDVHPHGSCPSIVEHYRKLVGLSISRGFNRQIRELFGGPRACTHTTALLQAMAPAATQALWSMRVQGRQADDDSPFTGSPERVEEMVRGNLNTCHVWAEDGDHVTGLRNGEEPEVPLWISQRQTKLNGA